MATPTQRPTHLPKTALGRRVLLRDLGRAALGAVVLGPSLSACTNGSDTATGDTAIDPTAAAPEDLDGTASGDGAVDGGAVVDGATWERASFGFVSAYVLVRDGEALIFDTGTGDDIAPLTDALTAAGVGWGDVGHVVVSHEHGDHLGGIDLVVAEAPEATVYAARPDLDAVLQRVAGAKEVTDGDDMLGLQVIATPGHTAGHISGLVPGLGLLLAGDALTNGVQVGGSTGDGVEGSPPQFTADAAQARTSVQTLAGLSYDTAVFGHGEPLDGDAAAAVAEYAASL